MTSSVLNVLNTTNKNTNVYSAERCIFCNVLLNGKSKILKCLHIACTNCLSKIPTNSSKCSLVLCLLNYLILYIMLKYIMHMFCLVIYCKCSEISKDKLIDYPIVSPGVPCNIKCSEKTCIEVAKRICVLCNLIFCKRCSKVIKNLIKTTISCLFGYTFIEIFMLTGTFEVY